MMRKMHWAVRVIVFVPVGIAIIALFGYGLMALWNWLMPSLFGFHTITYWQALGLFILCKIFFGGFRGGHKQRGQWKHRMKERWQRMSPEEREKFMQNLRENCGFDPSGSGPRAETAPKSPAT